MSAMSLLFLENRKYNSLLIQHYVEVDLFIISELRRAKRLGGVPRVRNLGKPIEPKNFGYDVSVQPTDRPTTNLYIVSVRERGFLRLFSRNIG